MNCHPLAQGCHRFISRMISQGYVRITHLLYISGNLPENICYPPLLLNITAIHHYKMAKDNQHNWLITFNTVLLIQKTFILRFPVGCQLFCSFQQISLLLCKEINHSLYDSKHAEAVRASGYECTAKTTAQTHPYQRRPQQLTSGD